MLHYNCIFRSANSPFASPHLFVSNISQCWQAPPLPSVNHPTPTPTASPRNIQAATHMDKHYGIYQRGAGLNYLRCFGHKVSDKQQNNVLCRAVVLKVGSPGVRELVLGGPLHKKKKIK